MPATSDSLRFCAYCGVALAAEALPILHACCAQCGRITHACPVPLGPVVLVLIEVFAEDRCLLIKRGQPPYRGKWAPPGGFAERSESLEAAAARELSEEAGVVLRKEQLIPRGIVSLPALNQVHIMFMAKLDHRVPLRPRLPETVDAAWFSEADFPASELWAPGAGVDVSKVFATVRGGRLDFLQWSEGFQRIFTQEATATAMDPPLLRRSP